jgi:hypothetical protein
MTRARTIAFNIALIAWIMLGTLQFSTLVPRTGSYSGCHDGLGYVDMPYMSHSRAGTERNSQPTPDANCTERFGL